MQRTSPVHYIAPSAISITPNANDSANDIAVHIVRNTKIKVYSRGIVDMDSQAADYQEWTLTGRNRRLADDTAPYTIYARLNSTNKDDAYLVFAKKVYALGIWTDKYTALSFDGTSGRLYNGYWYVRLGDVPAPVDGKRTVDLDTGILGTEQFNSEWVANPDPLPLRVELSVTVNDEDAGPTPYVYWGETLVLTAMLKEGWTSDEKDRFDHWEIVRDTGNTQADNTWNAVDRSATFGQTGSIELMHGRGATQGVRDDFNSAVNTTFIVNAMENTGTEQSPVYAVLKSASICIMAETWEKYELSLAAQMVTFSPITKTYSPNNGIGFNIRATDQKGDVFLMTNKQVTDAGLVAEYAVIDTDSWTAIAISGPGGNVAEGTVPQDAFTTNQQSINVRIKNGANKELHRATIAFLRDGEDSKEREWIFLRSTEAITFGTQEHPYPASISGGQVNPSGAATGSDTNKNQDGWVPEGWWDEQQGVDATNRYEYGAYRDFAKENGGVAAHWGAFTTPKIWNHYGKDGDNAPYDVLTYGRASTRVLSGGTPSGFDSTTGWQNVAPATSDTYPYIWERTQHYNSAGQQTSTSYVCLTGEDGEQGVPGGPGPAGEDAVNVVVSPASMIVQQDINDKDAIAYAADNNLGRFSIQVLKGSTACTITRIEAVATRVYVYNTSSTGPENPPGTCIWQPGATIADMYLKGIGKDNQNNYYTTGQITLSIYYTDPDTSSGKNITIIVKVYVNLIGSWSETIVGDTKTEVARSLTYGYDPDSGEVISLENFGQYIKSSEVNISRITKQVNNGKNMLKGVLTGDGWKTGSNDADVTLDSDGWFVANGVGGNTFKSPSFDVVKDNTITLSFWADSASSINVVFNRGGNTSTIGTTYDATTQRHRVSYTPAADGTCFVVINTAKIYHPQVEVGTTPTQFDASATEEESIMRQTSNSIEMSVSGKINAFNLMSLLNWTDGSNNVQAADVKLGKAGEANSLYSPQLYLDAGTYTFSGYYNNFYIRLLTSSNGSSETETQLEAHSTSERYQELNRSYATFTLDEPKYVRIRMYPPAQGTTGTLYRPQLERGSEMSRYVPCGDAIGSTGYAEITANAVGLGVRSDLGDVGIHIQGASQDRYVGVKGGKFKMLDENGNATFVLDTNGNLVSQGDASFNGTVRAKNFYHRLCVVEGAGIDNTSTYNSCVSLYITNATEFKSYAEDDGFLSEVSNVQDGDVLIWDSEHYPIGVQFGQTFGGARACSGDADEVVYINTSSGQMISNSLYLPSAASCEGKKVTVYNKDILDRGVTVYSADTTGEEISGSCSIDNNHNVVINSSLPGQGYFIDGRDSCSFLAVNGGWLMLAYMKGPSQNQ